MTDKDTPGTTLDAEHSGGARTLRPGGTPAPSPRSGPADSGVNAVNHTPTDAPPPLDLGDLSEWDLPDDFEAPGVPDLPELPELAELERRTRIPEPSADSEASTRILPHRADRPTPGLSASLGQQESDLQTRVTQSGDLPAVLARNDQLARTDSSELDVLDVDYDSVIDDDGLEITADLPATRLDTAEVDLVASDDFDVTHANVGGSAGSSSASTLRIPPVADQEDAADEVEHDFGPSERITPIITSPVVAARRPTPEPMRALETPQADAGGETTSMLWMALAGIGLLVVVAIFLLLS